jgi:predicted transcriptional regulator
MALKLITYGLSASLKNSPVNRRRDHIQILAEMVFLCRTPKTKTYLMKQTNLSYRLLKTCMTQMLQQELVEYRQMNDGKKVVATQNGLNFLTKFIEVQNFLHKNNR